MAIQIVKKPAAIARPAASSQMAAKALQDKRNREPYTYFDTLVISATVVPPAAAAVNFAQIVNPMSFFNGRTEGNAGLEVTNAEDNNKIGQDFKCTAICIDVHAPTDAPRTGAVASAARFAEIICMFGIFALYFGTKRKLSAPVKSFPAGGGVYEATKIRTQAAAADSDSGSGSNGMPTAQARRTLTEPIVFKAGSTFRAEIRLPAVALADVQALTALAGNSAALVRVNLEGVRYSELMPGSPY